MPNTDYLSAVEARIDAILADGRGVNGALGTEAQARAIAAGTFRRQSDNAALDDPSFPAEAFDRGYVLRFTAASPDPATNNPYQSPQFSRLTLVVTVGYLYSAALPALVDAQGTETQAAAVFRADRRALSDGWRIERALVFPPLRGLDTDPAMVVCSRVATQWQDLGGGRSLGITTMELVLQADELSAYGP
jgi:hypothetical protein